MFSPGSDLFAQGQELSVEVNQRALIDKILARYSGEFTIFRELLQNADDAGAKTVKIRFYTEQGVKGSQSEASTLPDLKHVPIHRYVVSNDGIPFREQDWSRLRKIAEGNPDDDKIGAFGVGYYSVFAITEQPMVTSGSKWMAFYFKDGKDQLYARSGSLPSEQANDGWTNFTMDLRNPGPLEGPLDLARFLVTSLTFMNSIRKVEMWLDEWNLLELNKDVGVKKSVETSSLTRRRDARGSVSPEGIMHIQGIDCTGVKISAKVMRWLHDSGFIPPPLPPTRPVQAVASGFASMLHSALFARSSSPAVKATPPPPAPAKDLKEVLTSDMTLQIFGGEVRVNLRSALEKELERSTKKPPPKHTRLQLIFSNADDRKDQDKKDEVDGIFAGLKADLGGDRTARIFIGQATGQTTGFGGHLAGRFIPTVERESIDLIDKHVAIWNRELLYVGGYIARVVYEVEMGDIRKAWEGSGAQPDPPVQEWLSNRALHALRFFTYHASTPSPQISRNMELAFFESLGATSIPILSSLGVRGAEMVRMPHPTLMTFLSGVPVLPTDFVEKADLMVARLKERGMLRDISLDDVINQLSVTPLDDAKMIACLRWWQGMAKLPEYNPSLRVKLLDAAILTTKDPLVQEDNDRVVPLSQIKTFLNPAIIPTDMPLPSHTLPYSVSRHLNVPDLPIVFGWKELSLPDWLRFLAQPPMAQSGGSAERDITLSPVFSERVLSTLSRHWSPLSKQQQEDIIAILNQVACIPTKLGFKKPAEAYFSNVDLFPDLPIIVLPNSTIKGSLRNMLAAAGVRSHVDLQIVFTRLVGASKWSCYELMRYLVSVKDTLSDTEIARLKRTAAFPVEDSSGATPAHAETDDSKASSPRAIKRVTPDALYEPTAEHRKLKLDVLDWGAPWRPSSEEAKFAFTLGLRRKVLLPTVLQLAARQDDDELRTTALNYLIANVTHYSGFSAINHGDLAFVPALAPNGQRFFAKPTEAFLNPSCTVMGFATVAPLPDDGARKLKLLADVPTDRLVTALLDRPPATIDMAVKQYEYLATRMADFYKEGTLNKLKNVPFIRAKALQSKTGDPNATVLARPAEVFFAPTEPSSDSLYDVYKRLFLFVDYGQVANGFLEAVGVRKQPSTDQLASMIVRDPTRFLQLSQSGEVYLAQLRILATSYASLPAETKRQMTKSAFLLAGKKVVAEKSEKRRLLGAFGAKDEIAEDEEGQGTITWDLAKAADICIVDDSNAYNLFGTDIKSAPQEDLLEDFYARLGSPHLSALVKEEYKVGGMPAANTQTALALRGLVLERLALFLSERNRSSSDLTLEHLKKEGNFHVLETSSVSLKRTFKQGTMERTNVQQISAAVLKGRGNVVSLYLSRAVELDMYEVAVGLTKALFKRMRPDEPLLLMTILSTPLAALRRRGFNVDRILNQQKVERLAREAEFREQRAREEEKHPALTKGEKDRAVRELQDLFPNENRQTLEKALDEQKSDHLVNATNQLLTKSTSKPATTAATKSRSGPPSPEAKRRLSNSFSGAAGGPTTSLLNNLRSKFKASMPNGMHNETGPSSIGGSGPHAPPAAPSPPRSVTARAANDYITPAESIRQSAARAVQASRSTNDREIISHDRQTYVKESAGTYCDVSGVKKDLVAAGVVPGTTMPLFLSRDIQDSNKILQDHASAFSRFGSRVIMPVGRVFQLDPESLHIFYDTAGPLIAFNRAGSLFLNARYYLAWHDAQVSNNDMTEAFISWYFTLAHEIAHNLVQQHDSEHEFYMSSICETYLMALVKLVQSATGTVSDLVDVSV